MERLFNGQEIGNILNIPYATILQMAKRGDLPSVRIGGRVRFQASDIAGWIAAKRRDPKNLKK